MALVGLSEVLDEHPVSATGAGRVAFHLAQKRPSALRKFPARLEHLTPLEKIRARIHQHALRLQPVTAGAAGLLLVVLKGAGRTRVEHEADIRPIDAHPERHRGDHDVDAFVQEGLLMFTPNPVLETSVIGQCLVAKL